MNRYAGKARIGVIAILGVAALAIVGLHRFSGRAYSADPTPTMFVTDSCSEAVTAYPAATNGDVSPAAPAPTGQELRFHNFRVIDWKTVTDPAQKNEILDILGHSSNFGPLQSTCMYAEFGFAFQPSPGASTDDVLVSLSCGQVQAFNFVWPYSASGISRDVANRIVGVASKAFGAATTSPPRM